MKKFAGILLMLLLLCGAALAENTYHVEEFPIEEEDESIVAGWLYVPDGAENAPAVILCHGFNGTHRNMDGYAEYLAQRGYVCYTFDFCGGGTQSQSSGATTDMTLLTELDDLDAVVSFLAELDEVDASRLVIAGESQGGLVTALYTARNSETVRGAMLLYPGLMMADNARSQYADASEIPEKLDFMQMTVSGRHGRPDCTHQRVRKGADHLPRRADGDDSRCGAWVLSDRPRNGVQGNGSIPERD